jgi:hypothetical protein
MEPATRFDLEAAIQTWRAHLSEELAGQADALAELEEHLRTSVAALREAGLSGEESLLIAQRRLGSAPKLGAEFRQSNPASVWRRRVFWMALGCIGVHLWGSFVSPIRTWLSMQMTCTRMANDLDLILTNIVKQIASQESGRSEGELSEEKHGGSEGQRYRK